jgi:hypothetical protein
MLAILVSIFAIAVTTASAQGVGISVSPADSYAAAEALAAGRYGTEVTPPQSEVSKGATAFMRLGQAANQAAPSETINPFVTIPLPSWGPVDLGYFDALPTTAHTLTSTKQWNVYLGCPSNDQTCWGNPQQFITDLNASKFIHVVDQYVGSTAPKRYPLSSTFIFNSSPVGTFLSEAATFNWLHAAVGAVGGAGASGTGNIFHLYLNAGIDVCADPYDSICYSPDNLPTFYFCGYHSYVDFGDYGRVYFTVEPYQQVNGCFLSAPDLTSATANVLSHEIFEAITDPNLDAWYGGGYPINNTGEEIGDECVWLHIYSQKLSPLHPAYWTQNEYSNKYHACVNKP